MERDESKFSIVYYLGASSPDPSQQDAIFYTGFGCVAKVLYEGFAVDIYCDGETKANLLDAPKGKVVSTLYFPHDFESAGLNTDDALSLANKQELLDWVNNAWFDLYCYGEHLDAVSHTLNEAIDMAKDYVYQEYFWAETLLNMLDK